MSLIEKSDGKNHISARFHKLVYLDRSKSLPDATGISGPDPGPDGADVTKSDMPGPSLLQPSPSEFAKDFLAEHSFSRTAGLSANHPVGAASSQAPATSKKCATVKLHSVFLRKGCILPNRVDPLQESVDDQWTMVEEIASPVFDAKIRQAGWHFMWVNGCSARRGFGTTRENATSRALIRALKGVARRFNAAELDAVQVAKYPGFYIAKVAVQPRQIQHHTAMEMADASQRS
jgi:hypothetical protein